MCLSFDGGFETEDKNEKFRFAGADHSEDGKSGENKVNFGFEVKPSLLWSIYLKNQ